MGEVAHLLRNGCASWPTAWSGCLDLFSHTYLHFKSLGLDFSKNRRVHGAAAAKKYIYTNQTFLKGSCGICKKFVGPKHAKSLKIDPQIDTVAL